MPFADLGLSDELLRAVTDSGYDTPTPIQKRGDPVGPDGQATSIGIAQTGTGKTAGFVLPMIDILAQGRSRARMPRSLILEPTRELAAQVAENFEKYGKYHKLSMALLIGGVQMGDQVKALEKGVDVLIATPGRLMDLFGRGKIMLNGCNLLVIDEADRMLDMGFIPDIEEICTKLPKAAADPAVLGDHAAADQEAGRQVPDRSQDDRGRPPGDRQRQYRPAAGRSCAATRSATRCATSCAPKSSRTRSSSATARPRCASSPPASSARASRSGRSRATWTSRDRIAEFDRFKNGEINILVASDVAARGLDVKGVSHVFNFDVPWQPDDYVHRIGRTGRAGMTGHRHHAGDAGRRRSDRRDREADRAQDRPRRRGRGKAEASPPIGRAPPRAAPKSRSNARRAPCPFGQSGRTCRRGRHPRARTRPNPPAGAAPRPRPAAGRQRPAPVVPRQAECRRRRRMEWPGPRFPVGDLVLGLRPPADIRRRSAAGTSR